MWHCGIPTTAKVRGHALAGGMGFALTWDIVVASDDDVFRTPEATVGLWPCMITVPPLRSMPAKAALEPMMTGRRDGAQAARIMGFVSRGVADALAKNSPAAIRLGRTAFYQVLDRSADQALPLLQAKPRQHQRHRRRGRGTRAFAEKRPPVWRSS